VRVDIGCGIKKRADIGVDIYRGSDADVIASAESLPFRDDVFEEAVSYECIGYETGPSEKMQALREAMRVAKIVRVYMWDEPKMMQEMLTVKHVKIRKAYKPTYLITEEQVYEYEENMGQVDWSFFCEYRFER